MRVMAFARRNALEMLRDPLTMIFGAGFPLVLLFLLSMIQRNVPAELFTPEKLAPGVAVFGQSFLTLFAAMLISRDRCSTLMMRLRTSPMRAVDFILGYVLPVIPMALAQCALCLLAALPLGLKPDGNMVVTMLVLLPGAVLHIALGLICGCLLNERQVGGVCGALFTNVSAWLSGVWFDLALLGNGFERAAHLLPFANSVDAARSAIAGCVDAAALAVVCVYALVLSGTAAVVFARRVRMA